MNLTNGTKGGEGIILTKKVIEKRILSNKNSEKRKLAYSNYKFSLKSYNDAVNKFNVIKDGDTFTGSRHCPSCKKEVLYSSIKETNLMRCLKRAEKEKRICISCKSSGEKNYFFGKKLNDGELKKERYGKKVLQCDLDGNVIQENVLESAKGEDETWTKTGTKNVYQGIDPSKLVPLLVKTIQELEARITALESA